MNTLLDVSVATDYERKLYQVQLHTSLRISPKDLDEYTTHGTIDGVTLDMLDYTAVMDFRKLVETMNYIRVLIVNGFTPVGKGTEYPDMVLPSQAQLTVERWR